MMSIPVLLPLSRCLQFQMVVALRETILAQGGTDLPEEMWQHVQSFVAVSKEDGF